MSEFEQIPEIKERIKRSKMELQEFGFYWAPEWDSQSCADQDFVNNFKKGWLYQQSKIEQLEKEKQALHNAFVYMDECRKEWHQGFMRLHEQKNKALKIIEDHARYIPQSTIDALEKALRGES
ncbi:hypothetical protein B9T31_17475 [Acinetobacter sp. ANC 4558]|uniref:hypothetical protein n=1 Tax=Acinetobacter sp. ANC 4558 TaxID=1977876 RepID=UPI000A32EEA1|nr:hypothetical protein [Acinetobacter sp. ANC 4558]OTG78502.1 hypothetical protein B9T31_17475 [Acinetobacter sp. ANC 4558]